jgi:hypothetical protein
MIEVETVDDFTYTVRISGRARVELLSNIPGLTPEETLGFILAEALDGWDSSSQFSGDLSDDMPF